MGSSGGAERIVGNEQLPRPFRNSSLQQDFIVLFAHFFPDHLSLRIKTKNNNKKTPIKYTLKITH